MLSRAIPVIGVLLFASRCSHGDGPPETLGGGLDAAAPVDAGPEPTPPRSGLTARPKNPTCLAPLRVPETGSEGLPARLSETGCFDPADPTRPLPGLIPYQVNAALWSDGAAKERWLALPDGATIEIQPDGDLELPPGAVTIKTFVLGGQRVETRFFVRLLSGEWAGYTYEWNEAADDATVLYEGSRERPVGDRKHYYPTRPECLKCHEKGAGYSLGLELAQLNREITYPGGRQANQLTTWEHIGLFDAALPAAAEQLPALPAPEDSRASLDARARAYLHVNCANCHRPGSDGSGTIDLRFSIPLAETMACDAEAVRGTLAAGPDARIITPGVPEKSILVVRMLDLGRGRMPEVASLIVDDQGTSLISDWVRSLTACP
jgi:uncharacterized repeat protein (TIGR03806 family)